MCGTINYKLHRAKDMNIFLLEKLEEQHGKLIDSSSQLKGNEFRIIIWRCKHRSSNESRLHPLQFQSSIQQMDRW